MARSTQDIEDSLKETLQDLNPSVDLKVGPLYDYLLRPLPPELAATETEVERLLRFYSSDFPVVALPSEARQFATNFGIGVSTGERATTTLVFYRSSPPAAGANLTIPVGALVSTTDVTLIYRVVQSVTMLGDFAATYFNPSNNRYEISTTVQAVASGIEYNVPAFRITRIITSQIDFDGVSQPVAADGGSEPETSFDLATRTISQFKGINLGSSQGLVETARRFIPTGIADIRVIRPTDRLEFRRPTVKPSLDMCVSGTDIQPFTEEYLANGGEISITLTTSSATSVSSVSVNGTALDDTNYSFILDSSPEYTGSTRAKNRIEFLVPLLANDVVEVIGTRNNLIDSLQDLFSENEDAIFETDILVRSFVDLPIVVGVEVRIKNSPNFNAADTEQVVTSVISEYIEPETVPEELRADLLANRLKTLIADVDSVRVFEFRRRKKSIDTVEAIYPLKNEIPRFDSTVAKITVKT